MKWAKAILTTVSLVLAVVTPAWSQGSDRRPATTTDWGDTGLWFVPTAEVLPNRAASFSFQRTETDFKQGNTNVSFLPVTGAFGMPKVEIFGALRMTSIDRDTSPLLFSSSDNKSGGLVNEFPTVHESWTGTKLGDVFLGGKLNLMSQQYVQPLALALRATVKFPTADKDSGVGTGEYDGFFDLIGSRQLRNVELAAFGGVALRGDPDDVSISDGIRWGAGAEFPTRRTLRVTTEVAGEWLLEDVVSAPAGFVVGADGSLSPASSYIQNEVNTVLGLTWQHPSGVLLGAALNYRFGLGADIPAQGGSRSFDGWGVNFRLGFHRGVRVYVPPPPAVAVAPEPPPPPPVAAAPEPPPAPAPAPPPANRGPSVRALCDPCTARVGQTAALRADASDPDGDSLSVRWSVTGGTLTDTRAAATSWRAESAPGLIHFTVTVDDGRGGSATDTLTIEVTESAIEFEDVRFDFDSHKLRPAALPLLDSVVAALKQQPHMHARIEGYTCDIGTAQHNLVLGERRARAVRDYLVKQGIDASRVTTVSYGEERPSHNNAQSSERPLNRRAALVVRADDDSQ
jgi:outer membrane protein OmpA-like peptidoglycan-associated protein